VRIGEVEIRGNGAGQGIVGSDFFYGSKFILRSRSWKRGSSRRGALHLYSVTLKTALS